MRVKGIEPLTSTIPARGLSVLLLVHLSVLLWITLLQGLRCVDSDGPAASMVRVTNLLDRADAVRDGSSGHF